MADFDQPNSLKLTQRCRTESGNMDDTLSEISSRDISELSRRGGLHPREALETYRRLQCDYDELLTKHARAENTIDQLRIGAKLNLYSDLPPPQQSNVVNVSRGKQPHVFSFPRASKASLSQPLVEQSNHLGTRGMTSTSSSNPLDFHHKTPDSEKIQSNLLTPEVRAEGIRTSLMFKLSNLQENVEDLQSHVTDGEWGEHELSELKDICDELIKRHGEMKQELIEAKQLERHGTSSGSNESFEGDFLQEDGLEGQLYRLGLRLDEINEQIEENLSNVQRNDDGVGHRAFDTPAQSMRRQNTDPELVALMNRLRSVKDSSRNDEVISRGSDHLQDEENKSHIENGHRDNDVTLGPLTGLTDDSADDADKKGNLSHSGIDLHESGYYASENMSVSVGDDPLSSQYLLNSARGAQHPLGGRGDRASFTQQDDGSSPERERPHSDTSLDTSPRRSRRTSQRSHTSTTDNHVTNPLTSYPEYISPVSPPDIKRSSPQASSSVLTEQTRHQPYLPHDDSRMSQSSGKRSRAGTTDPVEHVSRSVNPRVDSNHVDILRTEHDMPEQLTYRTRSSDADDIPQRGQYDVPVESLESSPRVEMKKSGQRRPGQQRTSLSSADSRVSTPLFHPGARPKDTRRRDKIRPPTTETERGFDSGFFGSEGSRGSRLAQSAAHEQNKLRHPSLREQTLSESEEERFHLSSTQTPLRSATKSREQKKRRSYLKSLSESDEERGLETSPSRTSLRSTANQRERRGHRHTPTFPVTRSDNERIRRPDESLRRPSSSPNLFEPSDLRRNARNVRPDPMRRTATEVERPARIGSRSDQDTRPMDKQSIRSYPGMDRESVRSGRRSRRDDDSSVYSDGARKYKRDPVDQLRDELQKLRTQHEDEANSRSLQAQMYDDLRRKHDDLERGIARKNAEQQMTDMLEGLRKKYDDLSKSIGQPRDSPPREVGDDLKGRLEELAMEVKNLKGKGNETNEATVRFLCPFCGGCGDHHHGSYYYPGFAGHRGTGPTTEQPGTPRGLHETGTQTALFVDDRGTPNARYPSTPQATSTPYYTGVVGSPAYHYHTNTYPGGVAPGLPVHHVHHIPDSRSRDRRAEDDEDYVSSDEDSYYRPKRRSSSYRRRGRESYHEDELDSRRLHLSLDEANRAAKQVQRISKRMLNSVATDLIRSGPR